MALSNRERIEQALRERQQKGLPNTMTPAERNTGVPARTPSPVDKGASRGPLGPVNGKTAPGAAFSPLDPTKTPDAISATAARQSEYERLQREKNRQRGRASTMVNGTLGDISPASIGRATLMGY